MTAEDRAQISVKCEICGRAITLEESKINEDGKPAHQLCYFAKITNRMTKIVEDR